MIFTRRFGALAARPDFNNTPDVDAELERELNEQLSDEHVDAERSAA